MAGPFSISLSTVQMPHLLLSFVFLGQEEPCVQIIARIRVIRADDYCQILIYLRVKLVPPSPKGLSLAR